ncbi:MAG TPA: prepilin peptidase [Patescibacteria group bacterium]|nr:prepilin peptidase [Patescibacteria group bacterium]
MIIAILLILGLCFGSFVNAFVWRLHEGRDWVSGRSECPNCHHQLGSKDLVPVFSWLWLRGKCRYCHKAIPDSPFVELIVPALFVLSYAVWSSELRGVGLFQFILWLVFLVAFVALALYDLRWFILPDKLVFPLIGLAIVWVLGSWALGGSWHSVAGSFVGMAIILGLFLGLYQISAGKWIGFGDVKLAIVLGLLAGGAMQACLLLFFASFLGVIISTPLIIAGKASRKSKLPFGPLLLMGMVLVQLFGANVISAYTRALGV